MTPITEAQAPASLAIGLITVLATQCFRLCRSERRHRHKMEEARQAQALLIKGSDGRREQQRQHQECIRANRRTSALLAATPF